MPALVQALIANHGYRNTGAKWRMAIPFDKERLSATSQPLTTFEDFDFDLR